MINSAPEHPATEYVAPVAIRTTPADKAPLHLLQKLQSAGLIVNVNVDGKYVHVNVKPAIWDNLEFSVKTGIASAAWLYAFNDNNLPSDQPIDKSNNEPVFIYDVNTNKSVALFNPDYGLSIK
jgi:hypothetical protein